MPKNGESSAHFEYSGQNGPKNRLVCMTVYPTDPNQFSQSGDIRSKEDKISYVLLFKSTSQLNRSENYGTFNCMGIFVKNHIKRPIFANNGHFFSLYFSIFHPFKNVFPPPLWGENVFKRAQNEWKIPKIANKGQKMEKQ